jgi:hypothetical protein
VAMIDVARSRLYQSGESPRTNSRRAGLFFLHKRPGTWLICAACSVK